MGIYLPNMEMPRDCVVCPLGWNGCNHQHDFVYMGERPSDCPLVPVPPHGDLIDRDALMKDGWTLHKEVIRMGGYAIHEMPLNNPNVQVVIPAEGSET